METKQSQITATPRDINVRIRAVTPKAPIDVVARMTSATKVHFIRKSFIIGAETEALLFWGTFLKQFFDSKQKKKVVYFLLFFMWAYPAMAIITVTTIAAPA